MENRFKFRAWDIEEKKMNYFQNKRGMQYNNDEIRISNGWDGYDNPKYWGGDDEDYVDRTDKYILMQCTGLKDKNGKLIYEGDIIKDYRLDRTLVIKFDKGKFIAFDKEIGTGVTLDILSEAKEVVGNEYENPELVEKANANNSKI